MHYLPINQVKAGMILGRDMYDFTDKILLHRGKALTEHLILRLQDYGYQGVYIDDELTNDLEIEEIISMELRTKALAAIQELDVDGVRDIAKEIVDSILQTGTVSLDMIDLRSFDDYTYYHSLNVAVLATIIGMGMEYSEDDLQALCIAGMFHDIGKQFIPQEIINKPGKITPEEFAIVKEHPQKSYDFLSDRLDITSNIKMGVLCHHENEDGTGYPLGLTGDKIHPFAKILHVVDVYDALSSKRPYKKAYARSEALEYLMGGSMSMFDENVINVFMKYVPIYPRGMGVILSDGREGVICENNKGSSLRPRIRLVNGEEIDLMDVERYSTLTILKQHDEEALTAEEIERIEQERKDLNEQLRTR